MYLDARSRGLSTYTTRQEGHFGLQPRFPGKYTHRRAPLSYQGKLSDEVVDILRELEEELGSIQERIVASRENARSDRRGLHKLFRGLATSDSTISDDVRQAFTLNVARLKEALLQSRQWEMPTTDESWEDFYFPEPISSGVNVIINANYRTGSSFTAELLNQHQDFMYMFEPLNIFTETSTEKPDVAIVNEVLSRLFVCNMSGSDLGNGGWTHQILCGIRKLTWN